MLKAVLTAVEERPQLKKAAEWPLRVHDAVRLASYGCLAGISIIPCAAGVGLALLVWNARPLAQRKISDVCIF